MDEDLLKSKWRLKQINWSGKKFPPYIVRSGTSKDYKTLKAAQITIKLHQVIADRMNLNRDGLVVDHINRDSLDNRRENLRVVSYRLNAINRTPSKTKSSSPFLGISWDKTRLNWRVVAEKNYRVNSIEEALKLRQSWERKQFACL